MVLPASTYPKSHVISAIDNNSVLFGKKLSEPMGIYPLVKTVMDGCFFTLEEYVQSMAELYKSPQQGFENLSKNYLKHKEDLICRIIEAEKIVEQEEKEQKEGEEKRQAKLAHIAAAKAAAPTICSVKVKPISGVSNQGGTIVFGGGRTLLHIEKRVNCILLPH